MVDYNIVLRANCFLLRFLSFYGVLRSDISIVEFHIVVSPEVTTYTDEEILEEMGPVQAVTGIIDP